MGEDEEVSIKEVADAIVKAVEFKGEYSVSCDVYRLECLHTYPPWFTQFDTSRSDGQFRKPASNEKLLQLIGGFKFTPFEEG